MLDFSHLMQSQSADVQIFSQGSATAFSDWHTWKKPRGVSFLYIFALDAGAGGGGGNTNVNGGGGGTGAQATLFIPAFLLPDLLYIQLGQGGAAGAASGGAGTAPTFHTIVSIEPQTAAVPNVFLLQPGSSFPAGGGAASGSTVGTGGAGAAAASVASCCLAGLGFSNFIGGTSGNSGTTSDVTFPTTGLTVTGGTSSGFNQGNVLGSQNFFLPIPPANANGSGGGFSSMKPFYNISAPIGGLSTSGIATVTGAKAPNGCGGVAGKGGSATPGGGGIGGDGLVIIMAW